MDYENKYNELVEAVRVIVENNPALCNIYKELGHLIELLSEKESEDEMIRKHIIDIIKDNAKLKCIPCDAEIAYLEKQKNLKYSEEYKGRLRLE